MINMFSSVSGKGKSLLTLLFALFVYGPAAYSETVEEDFEDVTVVDADGQPLANSWSVGSGLSNGWRVIGGSIYASDNGDYGLIHSEGSGFALSDYYVTSASTSVNNAYLFIPVRLKGDVLLWGRSNLNEKSKHTSTLKVYEATADGNVVTTNMLYSATPVKGSSEWKPFFFNIEGEGKYIAINLIYTDIDFLTATVDDGTTPEVELTLSADQLDYGTLSSEATQTFTVRSNVTTSVTFDITGSDHDAFIVADAPETLPAGVTKTVSVTMSATEPGDYKATLRVIAGEQTKKVTLMGTWEEKAPDTETPADWKGEDFTGLDDIPAEWTMADDASWDIDDWWTDTAPALKGHSGFICTPPFTIGEGQTMDFYFQKGMTYTWSSQCTVYYSTDKESWTEVETYDNSTDNGVKSIAFPAPGKYWLGFSVNAICYLDNFIIAVATTPTVPDVKAIMAAIASRQAPEECDLNNDGRVDIGDVITRLNIGN